MVDSKMKFLTPSSPLINEQPSQTKAMPKILLPSKILENWPIHLINSKEILIFHFPQDFITDLMTDLILSLWPYSAVLLLEYIMIIKNKSIESINITFWY